MERRVIPVFRPDSVNDPRFPKVVDRTGADPSQRNVEEMDMAGGIGRVPFSGKGSITFKG